MSKEKMMNKAEGAVPHGGNKRERPHTAGVGNERKGNMKGALGGAVAELHSQHPHKHDDHGPHHHTTSHIRHKPMRVS